MRPEDLHPSWEKIPGTNVWINKDGFAWNGSVFLKPSMKAGRACYGFPTPFGTSVRYSYVADIFKHVFKIEKEFTQKWCEWARAIVEQLNKKEREFYLKRFPKYDNAKPKRKCHDCGKPTNNYRCEKCWEKIREASGSLDNPDLEYNLHL